jgi:hypothetical protein
LVTVALCALVVSVLGVGCGPDNNIIWACLNPITGKIDGSIYDKNHYAPNGVFDPCHCYSTCGPSKECPITVDAGPPPADAGCAEGGDDWDGG